MVEFGCRHRLPASFTHFHALLVAFLPGQLGANPVHTCGGHADFLGDRPFSEALLAELTDQFFAFQGGHPGFLVLFFAAYALSRHTGTVKRSVGKCSKQHGLCHNYFVTHTACSRTDINFKDGE